MVLFLTRTEALLACAVIGCSAADPSDGNINGFAEGLEMPPAKVRRAFNTLLSKLLEEVA